MALLNRYPLCVPPQQLKPGEELTLTFNSHAFGPAHPAGQARVLLRLRGDVALAPACLYEGGLPMLFRDIDDALSADTLHAPYCLHFAPKGESWPRRAYFKIPFPPRRNAQYPIPPGSGMYRLQCLARAKEFSLLPGGVAELRVDCYQKQEGRDPREISGPPQLRFCLPLPTGSHGWQPCTLPVTLPPDTACLLVSITVENARGELWLEDPRLQNENGISLIPGFAPANRFHEYLNWFGENLCEKEWTDLQITANDAPPFEAKLFQRCYRGSENEILLPRGVLREGCNTLRLQNTSHYREALPWKLEAASLLVEAPAPVALLWYPKAALPGAEFGVLLKTQAPNTVITVETQGAQGPATLVCPKAGLQVLRLRAGHSLPVRFTCTADAHSVSGGLDRLLYKEGDGVLAGSGDAVYIPQDTAAMEDFLVWYLENRLGSMLTFRPVYRWCGTKSCEGAVWARLRALLNALGIYYTVILDGRELPGLNANPTNALLAGPYYLGNQAHERDGALYYWEQRQAHPTDVLFEELAERTLTHPDFIARLPVTYDGNNVYLCYSPVCARDMREAAAQFTEKAARLLRGVKRHTGPSVLFRYFFMAGLPVAGAELMYGPTEIILAALRGASAAYHRPTMAAHLAVQWGTTPHDTPERYRRYQLALFLSYTNGVHHINTEEGLYRMEELFAVEDRFGAACRAHREIAADFAKFAAVHTRRGTQQCGVALLHGNCDGWACFCRREIWGQHGWQFDTPEESWDLLKVFYPDSVLDAIYRHPCPAAPQGYYSRTPYGSVDILPVEADAQTLARYPALAFLGYNLADAAQLDRLRGYVAAGGTLLLGWPHLFTDADRQTALTGAPHPLEADALTGAHLHRFLPPDGEGLVLGQLTLAPTATVLQSLGGLPLVVENRLGKGRVYFVNARAYPADPRIRPVYEELLHRLGRQAVARAAPGGVLTSTDTLNYTRFDRPDGTRVLYAVDVDWYTPARTGAQAELLLADQHYPVLVRRGAINCFTIAQGAAVQTGDTETEVIALHQTPQGVQITLQGFGKTEITVFQQGGARVYPLTLCGPAEWFFPRAGEPYAL